jgi:hypothetical protein
MATDNTIFNGVGTTNFESTTGTAGVGNWLATIYSRKVLDFFKNASVVEGITNSDYLGEIAAFGDSVKIIKEPVITAKTYTRSLTTVDEELLDQGLTLTIDQANYFGFVVDDLEASLAHVNWKELATSSGAYALRDQFDSEVLQHMADNALAAHYINDVAYTNGLDINFDGGATDTNPLDLLSQMARILDLANVPEEGRYIVASPRFLEALVKAGSDLLSTDFNDGSTSLKNGLVMAAPLRGFRIHKTNNFPIYTTLTTVKTGNEMLVAGHMSAVATASQITNMETVRLESSFGDRVRGLHVYARGVVRPESLVVARITKYSNVDVGV